MVYVALLRGINVGGNNKVDMRQLKAAFEDAGMKSVTTYINSGNVIFSDGSHKPAKIVTLLEGIIKTKFGFAIKVLVRDIDNVVAIVKALPRVWQNNADMKCDVMFLWEAIDSPKVIDQLMIKPGIDHVRYAGGAVLWRVDRKNAAKSGMQKLVGTKLYKQMTIRNCNTVRKLQEYMQLTDTSI